MRLAHILNAVYCQPWLIRPEMHDAIDKIVQAHYTGEAHAADGIVALFGEPDEKEESLLEVVDGVGIVTLSGVMGKKVGAFMKMSGVVDVDDVSEALAEAVARDDVKGIVLNIDSPGGSALGTPELADDIMQARAIKKVIAFTDTTANSGAFWVGSQAWAFVAAGSASIGSVGVFLAILDRSEAFKAAGMKQDVIKAGKLKGAGIDGTTLSDEQRAHFQQLVDFIHAEFRTAVRRGRGVTISDDVMEGQAFLGAQALEHGLIDSIGTMQDAMALAKQ